MMVESRPRWLSTESFGLVLLLFSAVIYSVAGVFVKLASNTGLSSSELVLLRAIFQGSIVVTAMIVYTTDEGTRLLWQPFGSTREIVKVCLIRGIIGATGFCLYFYTIAVLPLGDATALVALKPVPTIFLGRLLLGEKIKVLHVLVTLSSVAGSILIAQPSFVFGKEHAQASFGHVTGLLGACCAAGVVILIRKAGNMGAHTLQLLFSWAFFGILFSAIALGNHWRLPSSLESWLYVLAMSVTGSTAHFLLNYGATLAPASLSSIVRSSDLMFAYLWEIIIFRQVPNLWTWTGVAFISISLIMIAVQKVRDREHEVTIKRRSSEVNLDDDDDGTIVSTEVDSVRHDHDFELSTKGGIESTIKVNKDGRYTKVAASEES